jgi:hypothetical protein
MLLWAALGAAVLLWFLTRMPKSSDAAAGQHLPIKPNRWSDALRAT